MLDTGRWVIFVPVFLTLAMLASPVRGDVPRPRDPYVNDFAELLSAEEAEQVRELFQGLRDSEDVEATLVTIESIDDYGTGDDAIEPFATRLFDDWGIGDAKRNDGVLFLVAVEDRKVRIELGAGYGRRHDEAMQEVIDEKILPHFRNDDYGPGIVSGAVALVRHFGGPVHVEAPPVAEEEEDTAKVLAILGGMLGLALLMIAGGVYLDRRSRKCPQCGKITVSKESEVLEEPTEEAEGKKEVRKECGSCGWSAVHIVAFTAAAQGGTGGGGSFGGGVSGGGGASGGW